MERKSFLFFWFSNGARVLAFLQMPNHTSQSRTRCWLLLKSATWNFYCKLPAVVVPNPVIKGELL